MTKERGKGGCCQLWDSNPQPESNTSATQPKPPPQITRNQHHRTCYFSTQIHHISTAKATSPSICGNQHHRMCFVLIRSITSAQPCWCGCMDAVTFRNLSFLLSCCCWVWPAIALLSWSKYHWVWPAIAPLSWSKYHWVWPSYRGVSTTGSGPLIVE